MPIEVGIWRVGDKWGRITVSALELEKQLEDQLVGDLSILAPELLLVAVRYRLPLASSSTSLRSIRAERLLS